MKTSSLAFFGASVVMFCVTPAKAQTLFTENFDADHTANWVVNKSTGANANNAGSFAEFFYDYSASGIPSAPNSSGTTRGLRLRANVTGGIFSGLSVSPIGQSFLGNYKVSFDLWMNYQGPLETGGNGTTQITGMGIGTAGTTAQWAGGAHDSLHFGVTVDGGSTQDYRVYPKAALAVATSGMYAAGNTTSTPDVRNDTHPYYAGLGEKTAPAAQTTLFPGQTGTTRTGAAGFAWREVEITKQGNTVTWTLDDRLIATVDVSTITFGGNNILLSYYDSNAASSTDATATDLLFGLIDNLTVTVVPEPSSAALALLGGAGLLLFRRRK